MQREALGLDTGGENSCTPEGQMQILKRNSFIKGHQQGEVVGYNKALEEIEKLKKGLRPCPNHPDVLTAQCGICDGTFPKIKKPKIVSKEGRSMFPSWNET